MSAIWKLNFAHLTLVQFRTEWLLLGSTQRKMRKILSQKKEKRKNKRGKEKDNKTEKERKITKPNNKTEPKQLREHAC